MTLRQLNITGLLLASAFVLTACPRIRTSSPNATGGGSATGGSTATGGAVYTGGEITDGGVVGTGGRIGTGGFVGTGGIVATGGLIPTGGTARTGGLISTGGSEQTGGVQDPASCGFISTEFDGEMNRIQSCDAANECGQVIPGSSCGCTRDLVARLDANFSELDRLLGVEVNGEPCVSLGSTCDCPAADGFDCVAGRCAWNYTTSNPTPIQPICSLPKKPGPCKASMLRYFYNVDTAACQEFTYGGCQGNANNFETEKACEVECGSTGDACTQPVVVGPCDAAMPRFFYNVNRGDCEAFTYGGCQGNANNFETEKACQASCLASK